VLTIRARRMIDTNLLPAVENPDSFLRQVGAHRVSRRTQVTLGATLCFGSLGFVYTGPTESIVGRTFVRLPRPSVLTGATGREAFV
jgi:hypothetical protein